MARLISTLLISLLATAALAAEKPRVDVPLGDSPVRGPEDAIVTMVEFIDFQ